MVVREVDFPIEKDPDGLPITHHNIFLDQLPAHGWYLENEMSLQYHKLRTEIYVLLTGKLLVYRGKLQEDLIKTVADLEEVIMEEAPADNPLYHATLLIPPGTVHCPVTLHKPFSTVLEVSHGVTYDEEDIVRIHDMHGRATLSDFPVGTPIRDLVRMCREQVYGQKRNL